VLERSLERVYSGVRQYENSQSTRLLLLVSFSTSVYSLSSTLVSTRETTSTFVRQTQKWYSNATGTTPKGTTLSSSLALALLLSLSRSSRGVSSTSVRETSTSVTSSRSLGVAVALARDRALD
jgi:hypothetical protein